jgi:hypothetical protein
MLKSVSKSCSFTFCQNGGFLTVTAVSFSDQKFFARQIYRYLVIDFQRLTRPFLLTSII